MRGIRAISCNVFSRSQVASRDPPLFRITERYLYSKSDMARFIAAVMINVHIEVLDYELVFFSSSSVCNCSWYGLGSFVVSVDRVFPDKSFSIELFLNLTSII